MTRSIGIAAVAGVMAVGLLTAACGSPMISLGFHALRGIREPQELFTIGDD